MNITDTPNLKPLRDYNPHELINGRFTPNVGTMNKGTFVSIVSASGNNNVAYSGNNPPTPQWSMSSSNLTGTPSYAVSRRWSLIDTVRAATSTDVVLGVTMNDVKDTNIYGENLFWDRNRKMANQIVLSGEAVPILTRGIIRTNNFVGTPVPGSGATVSGGILVVAAYSNSIYNVGKWLKPADYDGYALFKVEL